MTGLGRVFGSMPMVAAGLFLLPVRVIKHSGLFHWARCSYATDLYKGATLGISLVTNVRRISVKEVMKTDFGTIDGRATIKEALHEMKRLKSTVLVVNKRDENDEYGLIVVSDIAEQVLARDRSPSRVNVYEIMTKPAISVDPNMDIRYCSRLMSALKLTRILVVKDNVLLGRVSPRALVLDGLAAIEADD